MAGPGTGGVASPRGGCRRRIRETVQAVLLSAREPLGAMILFFGDDVVDDGMHALRNILAMIDAERARIDAALIAVTEECPLHEEADELAGLGFVACQRYITQVAAQFEVPRNAAVAAGPAAPSGQAAASLVDAAANAWKHEAEWRDPPERRQEATADRLVADLPEQGGDYKYVNALHAVCPDGRFASMADLLVRWRDAVTVRSPHRPAPTVADAPEDGRAEPPAEREAPTAPGAEATPRGMAREPG